MILTETLQWSLLAISGLVLALGLVLVTRRALWRAAERRRRRLAEPLRPVLLHLAGDDQREVDAAVALLTCLPRRQWKALQPSVMSMLGSVRGEVHEALVEVLERRRELVAAQHRTHSRDPVTRARAAEELGVAGRRRSLPDLVRLLDDKDPEVRAVAARALGRIGDPRAAAFLLRTVSGPRPVPPRIAARAVMRLGATAHADLAEAMGAPEPLTRAIAVEIAGLAGAVGTFAALRARLDQDGDAEVRVRAARALGRLGLPGAVAGLIAATGQDQPAALRIVSARALGDLGDPAAVEALAFLLDAPEHRLAGNAARALARLGPAGVAVLLDRAARPPQAGLDAGAHAREALATLRGEPRHSTAAPSLAGVPRDLPQEVGR